MGPLRSAITLITALTLLAGSGCSTARWDEGGLSPYGIQGSQAPGAPSAPRGANTDRSYLPPARARGPRIPMPAPASPLSSDRSPSAYFLKPLDPILISLRSIPVPQDIEDIIDESGAINLPYLGRVKAAGKTSSMLEQEIQKLYLQKEIYKRVTVNVLIPSQSYYVRGEVRQPGRYPLISGVTILQALAAAGGYTEFASPKKIKIIRGDKTFYHNVPELEKNPERDEDVKSGDVIVVPRSVF